MTLDGWGHTLRSRSALAGAPLSCRPILGHIPVPIATIPCLTWTYKQIWATVNKANVFLFFVGFFRFFKPTFMRANSRPHEWTAPCPNCRGRGGWNWFLYDNILRNIWPEQKMSIIAQLNIPQLNQNYRVQSDKIIYIKKTIFNLKCNQN